MPAETEGRGALVTSGALALVLCALFLASVARFYHPGVGFSALLIIPQGHEYEIPALQRIPVPSSTSPGTHDARALRSARDGARSRSRDRPCDGRRTARGGFSSLDGGCVRPRPPGLILQTFALQNVLSWLLLARARDTLVPADDATFLRVVDRLDVQPRPAASVRMSLLDGPSLLLLACAVALRAWTALAQRDRAGIAGLGRETNLLGAVALPWPRG